MAFVQSGLCKSLAVICSLLLASVVALSQTTPPTAQGSEQQRAAVNLNVIITDEANHFVNDVRREDVRVTEDGTAQTINSFALEEKPAHYGLMIDTTGSMRAILDQVIATGHAVIKANRPGDKTFVMHYVDADTIEFDTGLTANQAALDAALDDLFIEGGLTATLDALHHALDFALRSRTEDDQTPKRRALVLITDGEDRGSRQSNPETLLSRLRQSDVQVFVIGLTKLSKEMRNREQAVQLLTRIAQESGGRAFFPKSFSEMPDVLKELTHDLHTQYVISYIPSNEKHDGSFRKLQVTLAPGKSKRTVMTRAGYNAP
jgi:Ca-activated chloride channel family protein